MAVIGVLSCCRQRHCKLINSVDTSVFTLNARFFWLLTQYVKLKYGPLGTLALWASGTRSQSTAQECTEEDNEDYINASSSHNATTQPLTDFVNGDDSLSQLGHIEDSLLDDAVLQGVLQEGLEENRVRAMSDA